MKKRILPLFLTLLLITTPALATQGSMEHFVRAKTYQGEFSDLTTDSVFYDNVSALFEYGLSVGKSDGTYGLKDHLTVGQSIIFAGRLRSLYRTGDAEAGAAAYAADGPAAMPYLKYLEAEQLLSAEEFSQQLYLPATRAQMARILANIFPDMPAINADLVTQAYATRRFIPDVTEYTPYYSDILRLYRCGICVGSDAAGSFLPDQPITRGAAAAMLTRLADPALRMVPDWSVREAYSAEGTTYGDLVVPGTYLAAPQTAEEVDQVVRYMLSGNKSVLTLRYPSLTEEQARTIMQHALAAVKRCCEQSYNSLECTFDLGGSMTLRFSANGTNGKLPTYREKTLQKAIAVHDQLWEDGQLTHTMTELEKAKVYYTWVCENSRYDTSADSNSLSHIPYSLFFKGTAVCDGYTGAYNLLLRLEGIDCTTLATADHIWTVATLDGTQYHIDTTWGDNAAQGVDYQFFAMSEEQSRLYHPW